MRIFLTGGSGLLGTQLAIELSKRHDVTAVGHSRPAAHGSRKASLDITDADAVAGALDGQGYTHLLHTAALRSPEECAEDVARAYLVNTIGVEHLAAACLRNRMKMLYVSTDYVFAGNAPPYREDALPGPVNLYGRTKLAGEHAVRAVLDHLVIRIPAMWGDDPEDPRGNQKLFVDLFRKGGRFAVESVLVRHYSLAGDIAKAIAFCLERDLAGTVHIAAKETQTKADYARALARLHGFDPGLVVDAGLPEGGIVRPQDPSLDVSLYESLQGPPVRGLSDVVKALKALKA